MLEAQLEFGPCDCRLSILSKQYNRTNSPKWGGRYTQACRHGIAGRLRRGAECTVRRSTAKNAYNLVAPVIDHDGNF
jgi:hypothetical protein